MKLRRLIPYLLLNVLVTTITVLVVLSIWDSTHGVDAPEVTIATSTPSESSGIIATPPPIDQKVIQVKNVFGVGEVNNEVVILENVWDRDLQLKDWTIKDQDGHTFTFPAVMLKSTSGAEVQVYSRVGNDELPALFWGMKSAVWRRGETVIVYDPVGIERDRFTIP